MAVNQADIIKGLEESFAKLNDYPDKKEYFFDFLHAYGLSQPLLYSKRAIRAARLALMATLRSLARFTLRLLVKMKTWMPRSRSLSNLMWLLRIKSALRW